MFRRQRFVGCPSQVSLDKSRGGRIDNILLASKEQAVAAISLNNGDIGMSYMLITFLIVSISSLASSPREQCY